MYREVKVYRHILNTKQKGRRFRRPFNSPFVHLPSDERFNVLLRTNATNHRSSNGLHGGTSISLASPPSFIPILNLLSPPCQGKITKESPMSDPPSFCTIPGKMSRIFRSVSRGDPYAGRIKSTGSVQVKISNGKLKFRSGPVR